VLLRAPTLIDTLMVMRLELGRRADYAVRAVVDLARHHQGGQRRKARVIAEEMDIPASYVPQILAELVRAGLVISLAGRDGGYQLARPTDEISLIEVIRAVEGDLGSRMCVLRSGPCRWDGVCAVHVPWGRAQNAMLDELAEITLAELVEIDAEIDAGTYEVPSDVARPLKGPGKST